MADPHGEHSALRALLSHPSTTSALRANVLQRWLEDSTQDAADLAPAADSPESPKLNTAPLELASPFSQAELDLPVSRMALQCPIPPKAASQRPKWSLTACSTTQSGAVSRYCSARRQLQAALSKLEQHPNDPGRQQAAHHAHIALAQRKVPFLYRGMPSFNEAMKIGCAGPLPALGIWRTLAFELAINGWTLGPKANFKDIQRAIVQWAVGASAGVVGEAALHRLATAWIERMSARFRAVHPAAVLTDLMVVKMNRIRPGWGDEVRAEILRRQIGSQVNLNLSMGAFAGSTAARCVALPPGSDPSLIKSVAVSNLPPSLAGFAVGAAITCNMVQAQVRVPRMETLNRVSARPRQERSEADAMADAQSLPLFYVHRAADVAPEFPTLPSAKNSFRPSQWSFGTPQRIDHPADLRFTGAPPAALRLVQEPGPTAAELARTCSALGTAVGVFALTRLLLKALAVKKS